MPSLSLSFRSSLTVNLDKLNMIDYNELEEMYEYVPTREVIRKSTDPVGSLTDNRRKVKPNRDGSHKRMMEWQRD